MRSNGMILSMVVAMSTIMGCSEKSDSQVSDTGSSSEELDGTEVSDEESDDGEDGQGSSSDDSDQQPGPVD